VGLTEDFIARYRREFDFYDQAARLVAQTLEVSLQAAGVRSIVTSRAKSVTRLEAKVRQRAATQPYTSVDDIYSDTSIWLVLAWRSTSLVSVIKSIPWSKGCSAVIGTPKTFPTGAQASYKKRFSGYWATHYRVQMRDVTLSDAQKRYAEARVEIQVASVVMHAWAEVEHDLVYKPLQGPCQTTNTPFWTN
jgi:ppGpp synthetase/RelA/SpoT-type nucleotidyltranferase